MEGQQRCGDLRHFPCGMNFSWKRRGGMALYSAIPGAVAAMAMRSSAQTLGIGEKHLPATYWRHWKMHNPKLPGLIRTNCLSKAAAMPAIWWHGSSDTTTALKRLTRSAGCTISPPSWEKEMPGDLFPI